MLIFTIYYTSKSLTIEKEENGQNCKHCGNHYELPMFNLQYMQVILEELLITILEELYAIFDHCVEINFALRRKVRNGTRIHVKGLCEDCQRGTAPVKRKRKWRRRRKEERNLASGIANLQFEEH